ncbi:DNA cytosine methyltransferase [Priestia megaterium]|uniref:DNA cytosine methyltransferase n=1 Tax=Priestia megaterium TaxID=1404 RepID=UPI002FFDD0F4
MVKIQERGRGKFKPAPDYDLDQVKGVLLEKIEEEMQLTIDEPNTYDFEELHYKANKANIVSLFCGAGGLDLGVELAGIDCILGADTVSDAFKDKEAFNSIRGEGLFHHVYSNDFFKEALETYQKNFPSEVFTHNKDIKKVKQFPKGDIVLGGFPCPGFSEAGPRLVDDPRNFLYIHFIRCLMQVKPKFFIAENVKGMLTLGKGEVFRQIVQDFSAAGYRVYHKLVNSRDYGVPQLRERVFLVGVREDIDFEYTFPNPTHGESPLLKPYVTLKEAIGDLEEDPGDFFEGSYSTIFMSRNRKKNWNEQSFTIQASGRQAPIHPGGIPMEKVDKDKWIFPDGDHNNRRLSVKEITRIQTFPDWYEFSDGGNEKMSKNGRLDKIYKQIGNAVPVQLGRAIARPIAQWLYQNAYKEEKAMEKVSLHEHGQNGVQTIK